MIRYTCKQEVHDFCKWNISFDCLQSLKRKRRGSCLPRWRHRNKLRRHKRSLPHLMTSAGILTLLTLQVMYYACVKSSKNSILSWWVKSCGFSLLPCHWSGKKRYFFATSLGDTSFAKANGYSNATNSGSKQLNPREIRWCLLFRIYTPREKAWQRDFPVPR